MRFDIEMSAERLFHNADDINRYIHAGKGVVTLMAPFGVHHSYLFSKPKDCDAFPDDVIFVYAVHKTADKDTLFYVGMIERNRFKLTRSSRFEHDTDIVRGAKYIVRMSLEQNLVETTPMTLYHNGHCAKCGRALSGSKAMRRGIGRKCYPRCGLSTINCSNN